MLVKSPSPGKSKLYHRNTFRASHANYIPFRLPDEVTIQLGSQEDCAGPESEERAAARFAFFKNLVSKRDMSDVQEDEGGSRDLSSRVV